MNYYEQSAKRAQAMLAKYHREHLETEAKQLEREHQAHQLELHRTRARRRARLPTRHCTTAATLLADWRKRWPLQSAVLEADPAESMLLTGRTGLGKTTALVALAIREINENRDARYVATGRTGAILMAEDELHTWADLERAPILILDELHRLPALNPKIATAVAALIDHRWSWSRPTYSAATCSLQQLAKGIRWELCRRYTIRIPDDYEPKGLRP